MNLLIIEDDLSAATTLATGLEAEGFDVTMVDDDENPVETAGALNPCAVLFDTTAPGEQEFDACREMRRLGRTEPILFLSRHHAPATAPMASTPAPMILSPSHSSSSNWSSGCAPI